MIHFCGHTAIEHRLLSEITSIQYRKHQLNCPVNVSPPSAAFHGAVSKLVVDMEQYASAFAKSSINGPQSQPAAEPTPSAFPVQTPGIFTTLSLSGMLSPSSTTSSSMPNDSLQCSESVDGSPPVFSYSSTAETPNSHSSYSPRTLFSPLSSSSTVSSLISSTSSMWTSSMLPELQQLVGGTDNPTTNESHTPVGCEHQQLCGGTVSNSYALTCEMPQQSSQSQGFHLLSSTPCDVAGLAALSPWSPAPTPTRPISALSTSSAATFSVFSDCHEVDCDTVKLQLNEPDALKKKMINAEKIPIFSLDFADLELTCLTSFVPGSAKNEIRRVNVKEKFTYYGNSFACYVIDCYA